MRGWEIASLTAWSVGDVGNKSGPVGILVHGHESKSSCSLYGAWAWTGVYQEQVFGLLLADGSVQAVSRIGKSVVLHPIGYSSVIVRQGMFKWQSSSSVSCKLYLCDFTNIVM